MAADVIQQGWLTKSNPKGRYWKRRWCVLKAEALYYFEDRETAESGGKPKGHVDLSAANLLTGPGTLSAKQVQTEFVFRLVVGRRTFYFCADNAQDLASWCGALLVATSGGMYDEDVFAMDPIPGLQKS